MTSRPRTDGTIPSALPIALALAGLLLPRARGGEAVDFDRQVRPLLAAKCFACHGPDGRRRKAELRLDVPTGTDAIAPGRAGASELIRRVVSDDPAERMPPPKAGDRLTPDQVGVLRAWIDAGATWTAHWSFVPPRRPPLPAVKHPAAARDPIDRFVLARLDAVGLTPTPEADRATLVRRLSLDLTGLPPTVEEADAFLADTRPDAYERLVDRLLASPHRGERLALDWLDAARYADTHGFQRDGGRDMTRWRDGVIDAFNRNTPFDRFTVEQLAGDLLPDPTPAQLVASGFNRNHMINVETGSVPEEFLDVYVADRVTTTATVWLGLTVGCARCHDHKYDPIPQADFYRLYAFFNNVPENGIDGASGNAAPVVTLPTPAQRAELDRLAAAISRGGKPEDVAALRRERAALEKRIPSAMVMREMPRPRGTFVLERGQYDRPVRRVEPGVPACLSPLPSGVPVNRLGLARWLVDRSNPLTARVAVNRVWQTFFGTGLVKTAEDFGSQGERPSHPELLDWLAVEFMEGGWDLKALERRIVTSAAYRRSSSAPAAAFAADPENRLLARGPRFRLPAEAVRDQALAVAGLLDRRVGGASVYPYQPPGIWEELCMREDQANFTAQVYTPSRGADLYRRGLYTFRKRTAPPPALAAFDAPDRETCTVRRLRTNTPLQALVLWNDPTYTEASRALAARVMRRAGSTDDRLTLAFRSVLTRTPGPGEVRVLRGLFEAQRAAFRRDPSAAAALAGVGESPRDPALDAVELGAWTVVAAAILSLDEAVTRG